jgi:hypothetical protein
MEGQINIQFGIKTTKKYKPEIQSRQHKHTQAISIQLTNETKRDGMNQNGENQTKPTFAALSV